MHAPCTHGDAIARAGILCSYKQLVGGGTRVCIGCGCAAVDERPLRIVCYCMHHIDAQAGQGQGHVYSGGVRALGHHILEVTFWKLHQCVAGLRVREVGVPSMGCDDVCWIGCAVPACVAGSWWLVQGLQLEAGAAVSAVTASHLQCSRVLQSPMPCHAMPCQNGSESAGGC
jgi:hypothetical protein